MGRRAIDNRVSSHRLLVIHRGIYAVGHLALRDEGYWAAAVLAAGDVATLSHRTGAALWQMLLEPERATPVDLIVPTAGKRRRGITFHIGQLNPNDVCRRQGLPVTTPPRTLLDLASAANRAELEHAVREAEFRRLVSLASLLDLRDRCRGRRGARALAEILDTRISGVGLPRSELERRFRAFVRDLGLPMPRFNHTLEVAGRRFEVDCAWPRQRLIVELDGRTAHETAGAFERDRERDRVILLAGWRSVRVTWWQLHRDQARLEADLRALLRRE
jgi:very-short-patch-repair endonuclease